MTQPSTPHPAPAQWHDAWLVTALAERGEPLAERAAEYADAPTAWDALRAAGLPEERISEVVCALSTAPIAELEHLTPEHASLLPASVAERYQVVPVRLEGGVLTIACSNPLRPGLEGDLAFATARRIQLAVASPSAIRELQQAMYPGAPATIEYTAGAASAGGNGPRPAARTEAAGALPQVALQQGDDSHGAIEMLDRIIGEALKHRASDIHMEPKADGMLVRLRVDGALFDAMTMSKELSGFVVSRLKVLAGLDIADRIRPQDGRSSTTYDGRTIDLRISTLPLGGLGEKVVVRILDSQTADVELSELGFTASEMYRLQKLLGTTEGMVLVTGPTGSGKTTTLYSVLRHVQSRASNIVTVEDPIEYRLDGINQVQVNERAGLTFASALRSILRQDPDVVLVGEIRDGETAGIAIKASMTGHLVLATLHTNDAPSAIARLLDIGSDPGALSGAVKGIVAQRLVRRLCADCSVPIPLAELPIDQQMLLMGKKTDKLRRAVGCRSCRNTGYRGRMVVAEVMVVPQEMQRAIARGADVPDLADLAKKGGMQCLWEAGVERVLAGHTSMHELLDNIAAPVEDTSAAQADIDSLLSQLLPSVGSAPSAPAAPSPPATVPVSATSSRPPASPAAAARAATRGGARVLVVDDDRAARQELRALLAREGFGVIEAADGEAALSYARKLRPDFVVTEVALPRLDAVGLIQALQEGAEPPAVLVLTGQTDDALVDWLRELGAVDVLAKPADAASLAARLSANQAAAA
jgi:type II secretory ATPase GspE/PulE/Tfp pilus assembly ATPase PilB-like protein/CheY-like chemotaxis protein